MNTFSQSSCNTGLGILLLLHVAINAHSQTCPPPGLPDPGGTCPDAPILCAGIDGYCSTVTNNNQPWDYPCCSPWGGSYHLTGDQWLGFVAGTETIEIQIVPENCSPGGGPPNQSGMNMGIYASCPSFHAPWDWCEANVVNLLCSCTEDPFSLFYDQFVVGQVYWLVLSICEYDACDYTINVLQGSTSGNEPNPTATTTQSTCNLPNGSIDLSVTGGASPYTYLWSNNETTEDLSSLLAGNYILTLTDANGCTNTLSVDVANNNPPITLAATVASNTSCNGGNGSINFVAMPPNPNYTYNWSNNETTQDISGLVPGDYTVTVNGDGTCTAEATFTVGDNPNLPNPTAIPTQSTCDLPNGSIHTVVTGGNAPYTYLWSNNETTQDLNNLLAGNYILTVTDANGCTNTLNVDVGNSNPPITLTASVISNTSCNNGNGSIDLTASPANPSYTYNWNLPATTQDISGLTAGDYTVTVNGGGSCTAEATYTINDNPNLPIPTALATDATCDFPNGSIIASVSGGVSPYIYLWSNGATTQDISNLIPGSYVLTVTGANGCSASISVDISNNNPAISISATIIPSTVCNGAPNGSINVTVAPPNPNYTYVWNTGGSSQDLNGVSPGNYTITVSAGGSCTAVAEFEVPGNPNQPSINMSSIPSSCDFSNGSANISVTGGTTPYTFIWTNGVTTQNLAGVLAGNYCVTVTSANGCSSENCVEVDNQNPPINLNVTVIPNTTCNSNTNGSINLSVLPSGNYTYIWSGGSTTQDLSNLAMGEYCVTVSAGGTCDETACFTIDDITELPVVYADVTDALCGFNNGAVDLTVDFGIAPYTYNWQHIPGNSNPQDISNIAAGTYVLTVTTAVGCSEVFFAEVLDRTLQLDIYALTSDDLSCTSDIGSINLDVEPILNYSYDWAHIPGPNNIQDLVNLSAGSYIVTVTYGTCTANTTIDIFDASLPPSVSIAPTAANCGQSDGAVTLTVNGATQPYTFDWSNLPGDNNPQNLVNVAPGIYTVAVTDFFGCTTTAFASVLNNTFDPQIGANITAAICGQNNGAIDLTINNGGAMPYIFAWSNAATSEDLNAILPGNYSVTVTDANGCTADSTFNVANNSNIFSLSATTSPYNNCVMVNGAVDLTITPAGSYTYLWSGGETTQDLNNLPAGTYTVQVTGAGSCIASATYFVVEDLSYPTFNQSVVAELCKLLNGSIDLSVLGGLAPFNYTWDNGQTTEDLSNIGGGIYSVTVTGANNCSTTAMVEVPENSLSFSLVSSIDPNTSCVVENGSIDLVVTPTVPNGGPGYTYFWSNNDISQDLNGIAANTYIVTVSAGGTCTLTASFVVDDAAGTPNIAEGITQAFCGQNNASINLTINAGAPPYAFTWSNGTTTEDLDNIPSGNYAVTVTGTNGCQIAESFAVPEDVIVPTLSGTTQPNTACIGSNGSVNLSILPTTLTYSIIWSNGATSETLANLPAGNYTVVVNGGGGCTASATYNISNNTMGVLASGTHQDILCFGENTGAINLVMTGGTMPFEFNWSPNLGNIEDPSGLTAGTYIVTVTDAVGCTATASFNIGQPDLVVQVSCAALNEVSDPGLADGIGQVQIGGGTAPYSVVMSPGGVQNSIGAGILTFNNLAAGGYDVTVTDANGCTDICNFILSIPACVSAAGNMDNDQIALCGSGCITANYDTLGQYLDSDDVLQFILHEGPGGTIVNEIARSNTPTFCFDQTTMNYGTNYFISAAVGNYNGSGNVDLDHYCTVIANGTPIVFYEKPVANAAMPKPINCATLMVGILGSSSMPGSNFMWSTADGNIAGNANQASIQADEAGNYTLIVDANGCFDTTATIVFDLRNDPDAQILASPDDVLDCVIDQIILAGETEGSTNANTIWIDASSNTYPGGTVLPINAPGTYWFAVLDTITFCTDTASIFIGENQVYPSLFIDPPAFLSCVIGSVTLTGGSPIGGILFEWATVIGQDTSILGTGNSLNVTSPGTYLFFGVDPVNGCNNSEDVIVIADQSFPTADAGAGFSIDCYGQTALLNGSATGGTGTLTYAWTITSGDILSGINTPTPTISEPGTYILLVTSSANGCSDSDAVVIDPEKPEAIITVDDPLCYGQTGSILIDTVLGAKPPIEYTLNGEPHNQTGNLFSNLAPGDYTILIEDANGCTTSVDATVTEPSELIVTVEPKVTVRLGESYQVDATVNVPPSEIAQTLWTPPLWLSCDTCLSTLIDTPLYTQTYHILVVTKAGCRDDAPFQLHVDKQVNVYIPNIFSPNDDGDDDWVTVFTNLHGVKQVITFQIYDRWGEQVFVRENFQPNDPRLGWNGQFQGHPMNPAVFVYYAIVEFIDGQEVLFKGDITLVR